MPDDPDVPVSALTDLVSHLLQGGGLDAALRAVCQLAVDIIPGGEESSVTILTDHRGITYGATGGLPVAADEQQYAAGTGPCLEAARASHVVLVNDLATDDRWSGVAPAMASEGARSSLSLPLSVRGETIGALNVYARQPGAFDTPDIGVGHAFASFAAVAVANARADTLADEAVRDMQAAIEHRAVIEQAKGILMGSMGCNADSAFAFLVEQSQHENRKLRDVAVDLVAAATRRASPPVTGTGLLGDA